MRTATLAAGLLALCMPFASGVAQRAGRLSIQTYDNETLKTEDGVPLTPPTWASDQSHDCPYPVAPKQAIKQPTTVLHTIVDTTGRPLETSVLKSSGSEQFDAAAVECLGKMRFQPAMRAKEPVRWQMAAKVDWVLMPPLTKTCEPLKKPYNDASTNTPPGELVIGDKESLKRPTKWIAVVCVCANEAGEVVQPIIMQSSGNARWDRDVIEGAKNSARNSKFKGPGCMEYAVAFKE